MRNYPAAPVFSCKFFLQDFRQSSKVGSKPHTNQSLTDRLPKDIVAVPLLYHPHGKRRARMAGPVRTRGDGTRPREAGRVGRQNKSNTGTPREKTSRAAQP